MGVSTGYCHVGNYGAVYRMAYTIVGRDANLAARLQYAAGKNRKTRHDNRGHGAVHGHIQTRNAATRRSWNRSGASDDETDR